MKKNSFLLLCIVMVIIGFSCTSNNKPGKLKGFVSDAVQLDPELFTGSEPISQIAAKLGESADKTMVINKSNITEVLEEAKNYGKVFIVVENHSIVKITDFNDCQKSTAWGACMPKGASLIQKSGNFEKESDYINNLIGKPDNQIRKIYLFK